MKTLLTTLTVLSISLCAFADNKDSAVETVKEAGRDAGKTVDKGVRAAKDAACPMVNGKVECALKKGKHKVENVVDEGKDKLDDTKKH